MLLLTRRDLSLTAACNTDALEFARHRRRFRTRLYSWRPQADLWDGGHRVPFVLRLPGGQLYDMEKDPGELTDGQAGHPEIVAGLTQLLKDHVAKGRSTPGAALKNDFEAIDIWKKRGK